jgi:GT2 family glycosyltransferase
MSKLTVNLVVWNGAKYMPFLFDSLKKQTYKDWTLFVLDNNSSDNSLELIKKELNTFPVQYKIIENKENRGFAGGHNQIFKQSDLQKSFTNQVDALGLKIYHSRRVVEQYTQQNWQELKNKFSSVELPVFGVSGALPVFRTSAIKKVAYADGGIFDESYHSYKEDVDLAYRLVVAGYKSFVLLDAAAYHDRSAAGPQQSDDVSAMDNKKKQSELVKYHSYKNHLATLYKNEYWQNLILDFPWILWYELKKFAYFLLFDRKVLGGLKDLFGQDWAKKRQLIKSLRQIGCQEIRKWWN